MCGHAAIGLNLSPSGCTFAAASARTSCGSSIAKSKIGYSKRNIARYYDATFAAR